MVCFVQCAVTSWVALCSVVLANILFAFVSLERLFWKARCSQDLRFKAYYCYSVEMSGSPDDVVLPSVEVVRVSAGGRLDDEEELCGVCFEKPAPDCLVKLWCCHNTLCVADAQHIGKCPFCRTEPLVWDIER